MVNFDDFKKLEVKIGTIVSAEKVEGADKLLKLMFDFGIAQVPPAPEAVAQPIEVVPEPQQRPLVQILSGIAEYYDPAALVGKQVPVIVNLEPRTLKGHVSNGMMLAVVVHDKPILLHPDKEVPPGSMLR